MKQNTHPTWHHDCQVSCSCGNQFTIGSLSQTLQVDICNKCHPFFTGEMKFVDRQGRVDKFLKKMQAAQEAQTARQTKKSKAPKSTQQDADKSYRQILREQQAELKQADTPAQAE